MKRYAVLCMIALAVAICTGCEMNPAATPTPAPTPTPAREERIPADAVKMTPETDQFPLILHLDAWEAPVPLPGPINTAGAEDSPFITPDGQDFYFFFTPDVRVPVEKQIIDGVTGLYRASKGSGAWGEPERVRLFDDEPSMDGCVCIVGDTMWFASVNAGNLGEIDVYTAQLADGRWTDVQNAGEQLNVDYDMGEFHITADGSTLYCGGNEKWSDFTGKDIYVLHRTGDGWSEPEALPAPINTAEYNEDQPFVTGDGGELWFTGQSRLGYLGPAVFRCVRQADGSWGEPEEIISNSAGEPTLDDAGNIYFIHHYFKPDENGELQIIEADVYVAYAKE